MKALRFYAPKDVSPDYGELFAKADYNFQDKVTLGARVFFAPDFNQSGWSTGIVDRLALARDVVLETTLSGRWFEINVNTDGRLRRGQVTCVACRVSSGAQNAMRPNATTKRVTRRALGGHGIYSIAESAAHP